jgi:hypothetical protein
MEARQAKGGHIAPIQGGARPPQMLVPSWPGR